MMYLDHIFIAQVDAPRQKLVDAEMGIFFVELRILDLYLQPVDS